MPRGVYDRSHLPPRVMSEEAKRKISAGNKGKKRTPEMNQANADRQRGVMRGPYNIDPDSEVQQQRRAKLAEAGRRQWERPGFREKMGPILSAAQQAREWTPEQRAEHGKRLSAVNRGRRAGVHLSNGYRRLSGIWDHPLSDVNGCVLEHRKVLYDKIGPGLHACHWGCGKMLEWGGRDGICVDHLDEDVFNNDPDNLVPSCLDCNWKRSRWASYAGDRGPETACPECGETWTSLKACHCTMCHHTFRSLSAFERHMPEHRKEEVA